jgi:hypothetical protein
MKKFLAVVALVLWSGIAAAQHSHGNMKGPNGGPMQDVAGVHAELVVSGNTVTINVFDEGNKSTSAKGFSGSLLIVAGSMRETVQLAVAGENSLKGEAKSPVPSGAAVTLMLKNAGGKSGQVKF